jgi:hypothetical protein
MPALDESSTDPVTGGRRFVAGLDAHGRATVLSSGPPSCSMDMHGVAIQELWRFDHPPTKPTDGGDPSSSDWQLNAREPGGFAWRLVRFTTSSAELHVTPTIDLIVVVQGRIDLLLEDGPVRLEQYDSAVIQQCMHGWQLVDDEPCTMVATMITMPER